MVMTLEDMGFEIESSHHEKRPGSMKLTSVMRVRWKPRTGL